jgi:hypothetical protein
VGETGFVLSDTEIPDGADDDRETASEKPLKLAIVAVVDADWPGFVLRELGLVDIPKSPVMSQT